LHQSLENYTRASNDPVALVPCETGPGRSAWRAKEPDAPGLFALISSTQSAAIPLAPETDSMTFSVFEEGNDKAIGSHVIEGRQGLNFWYLKNVGHEPDKESGGPRPIPEFIDDVAAHLLLRYFVGEAISDIGHAPGLDR